jgi:hypothetical protein
VGQWLTPVIRQRSGLRFEASLCKITRAKWTGGVAQVVGHLLCKQSSNLILPKKKEINYSIFSSHRILTDVNSIVIEHLLQNAKDYAVLSSIS